MRALPEIKLPGWLGGIEISFANLVLVGFFQNHDRVLDAWVTANADAARARFEEIEIVRKCGLAPLAGVILDGATTEALRPADLQLAFARPKTCVLVHGDPGTGKTRIACEIARWGMSVDGSKRLCKYIMLPVLLEENFGHTIGTDGSAFVRSVGEKLQILDVEPPPEEVITQLLRRKRLLVIIDGLSEMDEETRAIIRPANPDFPAHALLVTSHKEERLGGIRRTMIKTRPAPATGELANTEAVGIH